MCFSKESGNQGMEQYKQDDCSVFVSESLLQLLSKEFLIHIPFNLTRGKSDH